VLDVARPAGAAAAETLVATVVDDLHGSKPIDAANGVRYPGEGVLRTRAENDRLGIPVDDPIWQQILALP
jgi:3-dehydro-L-gulonate 2-dehydrogenase